MFKNSLILGFLLLMFPHSLYAGNILTCSTNFSNGNWMNTNNWSNCGGLYPGQTDDGQDRGVLVSSGDTLRYDLEDVNIKGFVLSSGGSLSVNGNSGLNDPQLFSTDEVFDSREGLINIISTDFTISSGNQDMQLGAISHIGPGNIELLSNGSIFLNEDVSFGSITTGLNGQIVIPDKLLTIDLVRDSTISVPVQLSPGSNLVINHAENSMFQMIGGISSPANTGQIMRFQLNKSEGQFVTSGVFEMGEFISSGNASIVPGGDMIGLIGGANTGNFTFNGPIELVSDMKFIQPGAQSVLSFNGGVEKFSGGFSFLVVEAAGQVNLNGAGSNGPIDLVVIDPSSQGPAGKITITEDVSTVQYQRYNIPVEIPTFSPGSPINFNSTNDLVEFNAGVYGVGGNSRVTLDLGGVDFELSALNMNEINELIISGSGNSILSNDWVFDRTQINFFEITQNIRAIGNIRLEGNLMTIEGGVTIDTGNLTVFSDNNFSIRGLWQGTVGSDKVTFESSVISSSSAVVDIPIEINNGRFTNFQGVMNSDVTLNNDTEYRGRNDIGGVLTFNDQSFYDVQTVNTNISQPPVIRELRFSSSGAQVSEFTISSLMSSYSRIAVIDGVSLDGQLILDVNRDVSPGDAFTIIDNRSVLAVQGQYTGLPEGAGVNDGNFIISYVGGDGNDVVLTATCFSQVEVTSANNDGPGSLRQAIADVCSGGNISFLNNADLIVLNSPLLIDKTVNIEGNSTVLVSPNSSEIIEITSEGVLNGSELLISGALGQGAIHNAGELLLNKVVIDRSNHDNTGAAGGGAIYNSGQATLHELYFHQNNANLGGAIFNDTTGVMSITNSTFFENGQVNSEQGGAILNLGSLTVTNSTLVDSGDGDVQGDAILNATLAGVLTLENTVISSNVSSGDLCVNSGAPATLALNQSFISDGSCGAGLSGDPLLGSWEVEGGFGRTFSPQKGSPLINAGDNQICPDEDALGNDRPQGLQCDIGAVEFIDSIMPLVTQVALNQSSLVQCQSFNGGRINNMGLTFSEPMLGIDEVMNYYLTHAGPDSNFDPPFVDDNGLFDFVDVTVDGNSETPSVVLTLNQTLPDGLYRLQMTDGITDEFNNPLSAPADFAYQFRIETGNLFVNAHFDDCNGVITTPWQFQSTTSTQAADNFGADFVASDIDLSGSFHSGSVRVATADSTLEYGISQCQNLPVTGPLTLSTQLQLESIVQTQNQGSNNTVDLVLACEMWSEADCMGQNIDELTFGLNQVGALNATSTISSALGDVDVDTASIACGVRVVPNDNNAFNVLLDGLKLTIEDLIFINGFE